MKEYVQRFTNFTLWLAMAIPYPNTAQSLLFVKIWGIIPKSLPDILNHHLWYHLLVARRLICIPPKPPSAHLASSKSLQLLQSSSVDIDGSFTASARWPSIATGSNYFITRDSCLVLADTNCYLLNCKVSQPMDSLNIFCIALGLNHAVVAVLALIMD